MLGKRTSSGMGVSKRLFVESSSSYVASMLRPQLSLTPLLPAGVLTNSDTGAKQKGALVGLLDRGSSVRRSGLLCAAPQPLLPLLGPILQT